MAKEISVLIPHYEDQNSLRKCLLSLRGQTVSYADFEVIVADNDSPSGTAVLQIEFPEVTFVTVKERGAAPARNEAMKTACGKIFAFTDADCVASPRWLEHGVAALEMCDYFGGHIEITCKAEHQPAPVELFELVFGFRQHLYLNRKHFSATANLFVTRQAAKMIGPFKNGVSEDKDWGQRAYALGLRLAFNDNCVVYHPARKSWEELTLKWERLILEQRAGFRKGDVLSNLKWFLLAVLIAVSCIPHLWLVVFSDKISQLSGKTAAAGVLIKIRLWRAAKMISLLSRSMSRQQADNKSWSLS